MDRQQTDGGGETDGQKAQRQTERWSKEDRWIEGTETDRQMDGWTDIWAEGRQTDGWRT